MHRFLLAVLLVATAAAQSLFKAELLDGLTYRNIGPFRAGGWISDLAIPDTDDPAYRFTFYASARHGGVWKTTNNGNTFTQIFDSTGVFSVGAVAVAPTHPETVWVGAGEASNARSAYSGNGIYKSTDGGKTWQHMGLADSHHIARIIVHPKNPDIVFVAAMGHLFTTNPERGLFRTTDGGKSWKKVLYVDEEVGVIDFIQQWSDPNVLYASTYEKRRTPWKFEDGGLRSGVYKSVDGGNTWKRLTNGLPTGKVGRIGIDLYQKTGKIVYAVLENFEPSPADKTRPIGGEVYRSEDAGATWRKMNSEKDDPSRKSGYAFNQLRVDPGNPDRIFITGSAMAGSEDGGKTWMGLERGRPSIFNRAFGDFRVLWIDHRDPRRMIAGSDGGVFLSYDGGKTCDHLANLPLGEIYALGVDMEDPYHVYAGLQDHESWKGPVNGWSGSVGVEDWVTVGTGDGMYNQVDPDGARYVYNTQEFGRPHRLDQKTRLRKPIFPARPQGAAQFRFNWVTPIVMSPHNAQTLYLGAEVLLKTVNRGETWQEISPDLTTNDPKKISPPRAAIQHCTIVTISESPRTPGLLWIGTDDGKVQITRNSGAAWLDVTPALTAAGAPADAWVTRVVASRFNEGAAYVAKSRHRQDDFEPWIYKTTDYGATWSRITTGLPAKPVNVVFEDQHAQNLLFAGTDGGVYVTINGGDTWVALKANMPPAPVHDLLVHPREGDLIAGTYGRGIWITDITPLRELSESALAAGAHFFTPRPRARRTEGALGNYRLYGNRHLQVPNEPNGLTFTYYLKAEAGGPVEIQVADLGGKQVWKNSGPAKAGINRVTWPALNAEPGQYEIGRAHV